MPARALRPRRRRLGVLLGVAALLLGASIPYASAAPHAASPGSGSTIVIGTGGLTWTDVSRTRTPGIWSFLRDGSSAAVSVRSVWTNTCPVDGWLGLGAGARAAPPAPGHSSRTPDEPCPPVPALSDGRVQGWSTYVKAASSNLMETRLGILGDEAQAAGICIAAIGPGAAVAAATRDGRVAQPSSFDWSTAGSSDGRMVLTTLLASCPLVLVDVGSVRDPQDLPAGEASPGASRAEQVAAIDRRIAAVHDAAPNGANILLASLSDAGRTERLRLAAAVGPAYGPGSLTSSSTRQPGLIQSSDVTVTTLSLAGLAVPDALGGAVLGRAADDSNSEALAAQRYQALVDEDLASYEVHKLVPPFFNGVVYTQLAIYVLVLLLWKGTIGREPTRRRMLRVVRAVAVVAAAIPVSTFLANLVPWWRFSSPMVGVTLAVAAFAVVIGGIALAGPWRRSLAGPMVVVSLATVLILGLDVMTGARLQISSLMGLQPVVAGRFYGMGNVTFALFATAAIIVAAMVANSLVLRGHKAMAALAATLICGAAVVVDGAPFWGADGGGPPALVPAAVFLVLTILGIRLTWKRIVLIALATVALFFGVAFADWLRPAASRTHLGRFFQSILDGSATDIVLRKGQQNLAILFGNYRLALLVPVALVFVIYVLARPTSWGSRALERAYERAPVFRPCLVALLVMLTLGFLLNDSGVAIPADGALIAVPFVIAMAAETLEADLRSTAPTRAARLGR